MGQTYTVYLRVKPKDYAGFNKESTRLIADDKCMDSMYKYLSTVDAIRYVLTVIPDRESFTLEQKGGWIEASNTFCAPYCYETNLMDWFESVAKFLENGSCLTCYPDSGHWTLTVKGGVAE